MFSCWLVHFYQSLHNHVSMVVVHLLCIQIQSLHMQTSRKDRAVFFEISFPAVFQHTLQSGEISNVDFYTTLDDFIAVDTRKCMCKDYIIMFAWHYYFLPNVAETLRGFTTQSCPFFALGTKHSIVVHPLLWAIAAVFRFHYNKSSNTQPFKNQ